MMALQTKILLATQDQLSLKVRPMGIVAGNAGRHLLVARILNTGTDRMTELSLAFMAGQANLVPITLQHGNLV